MLPSEKIGITVFDTEGDGMEGGYVAIAMCDGEDNEPMLLVEGASFTDLSFSVFSADMRNKGKGAKRLTHSSRKRRSHRGKGKGLPSFNVCEGGIIASD